MLERLREMLIEGVSVQKEMQDSREKLTCMDRKNV
jgi:hypothetical protein